MTQSLPSAIGPYPVTGKLGAGGFGTVYAGMRPGTGQRVAIKTMDRMGGDHRTVRAQLLREAQALRAVQSENCLRVYDVIDTAGVFALVTDYVDGVSLRDLLGARGPLSGPEALTVLWGATLGLEAVHSAGLIHGDVKPANILVEPTGNSRLIDFGLATAPGWVSEDDLAPWGSPAYASPEQVQFGYRDARSDIYSLTVTLYEALCQRRPFLGDTLDEVRWRHVNEPLPDPRLLVPDLGDDLTQLLMWGTSKDPAARPQNVATFRDHFARAAAARYGSQWWVGPSVGVASAALAAGGIASGVLVSGLVKSAVPAGIAAFGGVGAGATGTAAAASSTAAVTAGTAASGGIFAATGVKVAAAATALVVTAGGAGTAWVATDGFGSRGSGHVLSGERTGTLTVSDAPVARDLYAYSVDSGEDMFEVLVMEGTRDVASVVVEGTVEDYPEIEWSHDGRYAAVLSPFQLYVIDTANGSVSQRSCVETMNADGSATCSDALTFWGDRIVTTDRAESYYDPLLEETDLISIAADDVDDVRLLFDAEPGTVQWSSVRALDDGTLLALGRDSARYGSGYRGNAPGVLYAFSPDGEYQQLGDGYAEPVLEAVGPDPTTGQPTAVLLDGGSGGACSYGYSLAWVGPESVSGPDSLSDMFVNPEQGQESQDVSDVWFDAGGALQVSAASGLCDDFDGVLDGAPRRTWRFDGEDWVETGEADVLASRDLPSGKRLSVELDGPTSYWMTNEGGRLVAYDGEAVSVVAEGVGVLSTPPLPAGPMDAAAPSEGDYHDDVYRTKCGSPPMFTPVATEATNVGVNITYELRAVCPGGQWLNWSQIRVPLLVDGQTWADGYFNYSTNPYWIPEDGVEHTLTYPYAGTTVPYEEIAGAISGGVNVIEVPCEEGPDNSDDGPVPAAPTSQTGEDTVGSTGAPGSDEELQESALQALQRIAAEDEASIEELDWTAQLSSKRPGTRDDGIVYDTYDKILELHLAHRARYPATLLAWSGDWPGSYGPTSSDFWVTLSGDSYDATRPVLQWCRSEGWGAGDCWAKRLERAGDPVDSSDHPPADARHN